MDKKKKETIVLAFRIWSFAAITGIWIVMLAALVVMFGGCDVMFREQNQVIAAVEIIAVIVGYGVYLDMAWQYFKGVL